MELLDHSPPELDVHGQIVRATVKAVSVLVQQMLKQIADAILSAG